jgi:predicted dinucleotide-binding enzyme
MKIGIIGSNERAAAIARLLASGGNEVTMSGNGQGEETPYRQATTSDILVFAMPREQVDEAISATGSGVEAHAIVDAMEGPPKVPNAPSGAEALARKLDSHRVVRALIVLPQAGANIPICGDDAGAKALVDEAFKASGCLTADRGPLSRAAELEPPRAA